MGFPMTILNIYITCGYTGLHVLIHTVTATNYYKALQWMHVVTMYMCALNVCSYTGFHLVTRHIGLRPNVV